METNVGWLLSLDGDTEENVMLVSEMSGIGGGGWLADVREAWRARMVAWS